MALISSPLSKYSTFAWLRLVAQTTSGIFSSSKVFALRASFSTLIMPVIFSSPSFGTVSFRKFSLLFLASILKISSGVYPSAYSAPAIAPALVPEIISGIIPSSFSAFKTPRCAYPLAPPPLRTRPVAFRFVLL